jgi:thymidylate synthase
MKQYIDLLKDVLANGQLRDDRTGVSTLGVFGRQVRFDLNEGFPLVTVKRTHFPSIIKELLWILRGETNIDWLQAQGCTIWDEWADEDGELGPVYGHQWRNWDFEVDQIAKLIYALKTEPFSRRHIVTAWNPCDVPEAALPPCHVLFQFYVDNDRHLSCHMYQRSADLFLGVPFNIASYALLTHMIAKVCGFKVGELVISFGDLHLYSNHLLQAQLVVAREPMPLSTLSLANIDNINNFELGHFTLREYLSWPVVKAEVAV